MNVKIDNSWRKHIGAEFEKPYFAQLTDFVRQEYSTTACYPPGSLEPGQAQGLSFSVPAGVPFPPSLQNIFKEIQLDLGKPIPPTGDLTRWAEQGVLLLNATLTVRAHQAASHQRHGWEQFTDAAISALSAEREHLVFILWGGYARSKKQLIDRERHLVLESVHPSPLSANRGGWFGNHHFSLCNAYLREHGEQEIDW